MSGRFGDLSPEQQAALAEFKTKIPAGVVADDHHCLRFLRSRKFDVALASDLFAKDVAWRAENKIDAILDGPPLPEHRMGQLSTLVSCSYHGFDKVGRPLYIEKTGRIPVDGMLSYFTDAEMLHAHLWTNEFNAKRAKEGSERAGHVQDTFATILDLDGLTSSHKKLLDWAKHMTQIDQDHYPERLGFMAVINCPWYFPMFWAIVSSWIDPVTRAKFHILGSDYKEKLLELIDADQLPIEYGGTCDGSKCGKGAGKACLPVHDRDDAMKAFEVDESSMDIKEIVVKAGQKHEEVIKGQKGSVYSWYIKTTSNDLEVAVDFEPVSEVEKTDSIAVVHPRRFPTGEIPVQGSFSGPQDGTLKFVFDNSYSFWTTKTVRYHISVANNQ